VSPRFVPSARVHCGVGRGLAWLGWHGGAAQAFTDAVRADPGFFPHREAAGARAKVER
jgi:hypothetical protein